MTPPLFRPRVLAGSLVALAAVIALFDLTHLDLRVQDLFFDFTAGRWMIDGARPVLKLVFYSGIKIAIIVFTALLFLFAVLPARARACLCRLLPGVLTPLIAARRRDLLAVVATLATAPALVGVGKATTNIHYPCNIRRYGGDVLYVRLFEKFPDGERPAKRSKGFPAGHASGGFSLMSLAGLAATRRGRILGLSVGLAAGWTMGLYQQMRGVHYLSHTLVTMLVCWIVFLVWRMLLEAIARRTGGRQGALPANVEEIDVRDCCLPVSTASSDRQSRVL
ncbi:PAP2 (acid phosphatase) superfamily protein [Opitutaceae bacterium TAV1]|nr:PAP2 (acid phosphatase) superfamily protein [Opitutaceae bacterium TAV1]